MALRLHTTSVGPIEVPAAPAGGNPSHIAFSLAAVAAGPPPSASPFCIVGFYINPVPDGSSEGGQVNIELSRINGEGVIHPAIEIAEGNGVHPQDLVVSYGSVLSSPFSLSFHVSQSPSPTGPGQAYSLLGKVTFFADEGVTLSLTSEEP